jgi:hypothetical protein
MYLKMRLKKKKKADLEVDLREYFNSLGLFLVFHQKWAKEKIIEGTTKDIIKINLSVFAKKLVLNLNF